MNGISEDEKLKIIGIGGCWFAEESKETYDTFEELKRHYTGPYRYLCSEDAPIANPKKYDFFNPATNRGFLVSGGCWFSPSAKVSYDTMEDCSKYHNDCECICKDEYRKAFEILDGTPNKKSQIAKKRKRNEKGHFV